MRNWVSAARSFACAALLALGAPALSGAPAAAGEEDEDAYGDFRRTFELNIIHINDHHSHLEPDDGDLVIGQDAGGEDVEVEVELGGFPQVVRKIDDLRASLENEIVLHAGDAITGTIFYSIFGGAADAKMMNNVCFDAFALGNHEFDDSDQGLADFIGELNGSLRRPTWFKRAGPPRFGDCRTPVLAANVKPAIGTPLRPDRRTSLIQPFTIMLVGRERVGVIGIDIAGKTRESSSPLETTRFLDETETAQRNINFLRYLGVNKIVLLTHIQYANDLEMAANLTGVDVIVGGDSHSLLGESFADYGFNPVGPYPTVARDKRGKRVCVVQAWQYANVVGQLNVTFDRRGDVLSCDGTPHMIIAELDPDGAATPEQRAQADALIAAAPELSLVEADPQAQAELDVFAEEVEVLKQTVVATASEDLCFERVPGQGRSAICACTETWDNGGDITQLVTKAFLERSFTAELSIQNSGGVRTDIGAGDITINDAFTLLPFANTLVEIDMTGEQIATVLEEALSQFLDAGGSTGAMPYASGLRWDLDLAAAAGARLSNLEVLPKGTDAWLPLDLSRTYRVVANSFIAAGRDGYDTFGTIPDSQKTDTFIDYAQAFIDYLEQDLGGSVSRVPIEEYSTQSVQRIDRFNCGMTLASGS